jgi:hypothetical protein
MDRLSAFLQSDVTSALRVGLTMGLSVFGGAWLRVAVRRRSPSLLVGPALVVAILAFALGFFVFPGMARQIVRGGASAQGATWSWSRPCTRPSPKCSQM